jgi:predicted nucleic acid-binding protein
MNAVDTNIFVSTYTKGDPRRDAAIQLVDSLPAEETRLLWQVACETGAVLDRIERERSSRNRSVENPRLAVELLIERFTLVLPAPDVIVRGWDIHSKYQVSYWDAMLLAACVDAGCKTLYTADEQSQPVIEGVRIVNPFNP